jgi:putative peptidoglycan lipid II flippase
MGGGLYRSANAADPDDGPADERIGAAGPAAPGIPSSAEPSSAEPSSAEPSSAEPSGAEPEAVAVEPGAAENSAVMAIGSLVSRGTGFLRTAAIAAALGGLAAGNAYANAQFFPGMIYELLLGGILSSVLIPVLVRRRKADPDRGEAYTQRLLTLAVLALGMATLLAVLAAPLLTMLSAGAESTPEFRRLVTLLSYLMLPIIFFTGLSALFGAVLNTRGHFAAPMWAPILNNLVVMAAAGLFIALFGTDGMSLAEMGPAQIAVIGGGTLLGITVQVLGLLPALRKVDFRWRWRFGFRSLGLGELGRLGAWMLCYVGVSQVGVLVLLNVLNRASAGDGAAGVAIYNNVYLLMMMAHGIVAVSIITALLPRMSAAAADGRHADLAADLARGTRISTAVLAPISVAYAVLALPIAVTLFERGNFTRVDAERTAPVLVVAAIALVPFAISQLFTFAFYALADTRTPALINIPVVLLRIAVQIGLFVAFSHAFAASGTMIGNTVSYVVAAVLSAWLLRSRVGLIGLRGVSVTFGKVIVASLGAGLVGLVVVRLLPGGADPSRWQALLHLLAGGAAVAVAYLGLALALRVREITEVLGLVRRRLGR